jgi:DMSO/TMAO reductase YedYZ molybdopterin-dependent catalytic subunit
MSRRSWIYSLVVGCVASETAVVLQNLLRETWQIRTLPERVMEWLLIFIPLDLFERALGELGSNAKEVGLATTFVGMALLLVAIGALALRANWRALQLLGLGLGMWLVTMLVVMPVTGAGLFASGLLISPWLTSAGYLLVFFGYVDVLIVGRLLGRQPARRRPKTTARSERRVLLAGLLGFLAAGGVARFVGREGGLVESSLPLASAPTAQPTSQPAGALPPTPTSAPDTSQAAAPPTLPPTQAPVAAPTATLESLPNPPPPRRLARDKDGSLTAAGRTKGELASPITSNDDFYIVTKNAVADPVIDVVSWRLIVEGEVNRPVQLDYRALRALPVVEMARTLECISNFTSGCNLTSFGCDLISTARWRGARLGDVLALAGGLKPSAVGLAFVSTDEFSSGLPPTVVDDPESLIVYEMNGQPLPREHGFPARLLVPGRYGMKNPKWLAAIRAMPQEYAGWYERRNWNKDGIVKTMSRIDVPIDGVTLAAGEQRLAGVAYAGDRGIQRVEFSSDDGGTWQSSRILEPMPGKDTQVRWEAMFLLAQGQRLTITVRATDGTGAVQTDEFQLPQPDGASGRDQVTVSAA